MRLAVRIDLPLVPGLETDADEQSLARRPGRLGCPLLPLGLHVFLQTLGDLPQRQFAKVGARLPRWKKCSSARARLLRQMRT